MSSFDDVEAWCVQLRGWLPDGRTCGGRVRCYSFRRCSAWFTWLSFLRRCCGWRTCLLFPWWIWCALFLEVPLSIIVTLLSDSHVVQIRPSSHTVVVRSVCFACDVLAHRPLTHRPLTCVRRLCFGGHLRQPQFEKQVPATFRQLSV